MLERPPGGATMRLLAERTPSSTWVPADGDKVPGETWGEKGIGERESNLRAVDLKNFPGAQES